jgi:hypothetical protein
LSARARAELDMITADLMTSIGWIRDEIGIGSRVVDPRTEEHMVHIETFCAIALRVLRKTNPSKIRDAAMAEEISARISGREVIE